jgi:hypothetical protein
MNIARLCSALSLTINALLLSLPIASTARAQTADNPLPNVTLESTVTDMGSGQWLYRYTLVNSTPCISAECFSNSRVVEFDIPAFEDAGITDIQAPTDWSGFLTYSGVEFPCLCQVINGLMWEVNPNTNIGALPSGQSLAGFSYLASYGAMKYPYEGITFGHVFSGDPLGPASPLALASIAAPIPEESTGFLLLAGAALLTLRVRRRSRPDLSGSLLWDARPGFIATGGRPTAAG